MLPTATVSRDLAFVARMRWLRAIGLGLGFFAVASVFVTLHVHRLIWALLVLHGFAWPHLAFALARANANPRAAELRHLQVDAALAGGWIALMQFNLLPSVMIAVMLGIGKMHIGGARLLARSLAGLVLACALTSALNEFAFAPTTTMFHIVATLPLLVGYPLAVSASAHALMRQARDQNRHLEQLNRIDIATGLLNQTYWQHSVNQELHRFQRGGQPATLMMIDLDDFKRINDHHGHLVGDEIIRAVAATIRECTRDCDVCGRYGGDEFGVILTNTGAGGAQAVAERIRARVAELRLPGQPLLRCSVSVGIAEATREFEHARAWIERADAAMYRAKAEGRNRVAVPRGRGLVRVVS
jgi:diguanylate cyclase